MHKYRLWLWPLIFFALFTPFANFCDLTAARYFYHLGNGHFLENPLLEFLFVYGLIPGQVLLIGSLIALLLSYFGKSFRSLRNPSLLLVLTAALGAGIIVHAAFKDHWGRPRPRQVIEFGGTQEYRPFYKPNFRDQPEPSKSFSCGHCTMGFYFFALALAGKRLNNNLLRRSAFFLAFFLGAVLGIARMAQGGHFLSDVIVSGLIMWWTALTVDWLLYERPD